MENIIEESEDEEVEDEKVFKETLYIIYIVIGL